MATPPTHPPTTSRLSDTASAWFGSLAGASLWILVLALVMAAHEARVALLCACLFALVAVAGVVLHATRVTRAPLASYLLLLLVSGLAGLAALLAVDAAGLSSVLRAPFFVGTPSPYPFLLVYPAIAVVFVLVDGRRASRVPSSGP